MNAKKSIVIFAYTRQGMATARKAAECFSNADLHFYTIPRLAEDPFQPMETSVESFYGELFQWADVMIFVSALGIAVRKVAPWVKDKREDPAVLCMDELGQFVIPMLSGHIGGANELAQMIAAHMKAQAVITTATDIHGRFSVDTWARKQGLVIADMKMAKEVSAAILEQEISLVSDFPIVTDLPEGCSDFSKEAEIGICISWEDKQPFPKTLRLIPPILHLGIGCRKGIAKEQISAFVEEVFMEYRIDRRAVKGVYSIDLKADEKGLKDFCSENGWPFTVYSAEELNQVPGVFSASDFVKSTTGVDNICERAALKEASRLIVKKNARDGVTAAIAAEDLEIAF